MLGLPTSSNIQLHHILASATPTAEDTGHGLSFTTADSRQFYPPTTSEASSNGVSFNTAESTRFCTPVSIRHLGLEEQESAAEETGRVAPHEELSSTLTDQQSRFDHCSAYSSYKPPKDCLAKQPQTKMSESVPAQGHTKVIDWVEQQALGEGPVLQDADKTSYQPPTKIPGGRHYDILTLLNIRATTDPSNVHLRIHPGALHGTCGIPAVLLVHLRTYRSLSCIL